MCVRALADAEVLDAGWIELCGLLCVPLNMTKHQRCKQSVYSGFSLMRCMDEKLELLLALSADFGSAEQALAALRPRPGQGSIPGLAAGDSPRARNGAAAGCGASGGGGMLPPATCRLPCLLFHLPCRLLCL
jgi:hypothetical protein